VDLFLRRFAESPLHHVQPGTGRRLIFLRIISPRSSSTPGFIFGIDTPRVPQFFADIDMHDLVLLDIRTLGPGTGWGRVPTPMF
jgi:hypothetical protein